MGTNVSIACATAAASIFLVTAASADDKKPAASKPAATAAVAKDPACMTRTGSRIPVKTKGCTGFGRSYSTEDLKRTGATNVGSALRVLDSSIAAPR
jgi:hypothetical protein